METKLLLYGLIGFFIGGLLVSIAATTFAKPQSDMGEMTAALEQKTGDKYDAAFIQYMIEHHRAAVDMAHLSADNARHEEIKQLSRDIISAQNREIQQMKQWQQEWGYATDENHGAISH